MTLHIHPKAAQPNASATLESHHRDIETSFDAFIVLARSGSIQRDSVLPAISSLRRHLWVEEEYFFPPLREAGVVAPVQIMLREHAELWRLMDELERLLTFRNPDPDLLATVAAAIVQLSARHCEKEELILFATADQFLDASINARVEEGLTLERPADWVTELARS